MTPVVIHPLFLSFSNEEVEDQYVHFRTLRTLAAVDVYFLCLNFVLHAAFVALELLKADRADGTSVLLAVVLGLMVILLQGAVMVHLGETGWMKHRAPSIVVFRALRTIVSMYGVPRRVRDPPSLGPTSLFKNMFFGSGTLIIAWNACGMPLLFKHHIVVQAAGVVLMVILAGRRFCATTFERSDVRELFDRLWKTLDDLMVLVAGAPATEDMEVMRASRWAACFQVVMLVHLCLGFLVPTLILWQLELHSRRSYATAMTANPMWAHVRFDDSWVPDLARTIVVCVLGLAGIWTMVTDMAASIPGQVAKQPEL